MAVVFLWLAGTNPVRGVDRTVAPMGPMVFRQAHYQHAHLMPCQPLGFAECYMAAMLDSASKKPLVDTSTD
jgi:hypothetical protein